MVELLKGGGQIFVQLIADVFTDVLQPKTDVPSYWKETRLKVLFKKGDPTLPENYRPTAVIPPIYKQFSKLLCSRMRKRLTNSSLATNSGSDQVFLARTICLHILC